MSSYLLKNAVVIDAERSICEKRDVAVQDGVIVDAKSIKNPKVIDLEGKFLSPGFIDLHVHLRDPGNTMAENIATGTKAAAAGGFTSIVAMPNTNPPADTAAAIEFLKQNSASKGAVRVLPCGCMTKGYAGEEMAGIGALKNAGVVALSDDGRCIQNHALMRHVIEYANSFDLPILDHCEDNYLMANGIMHEGQWSVLLGMKGIPSAAEELMVSRDLILARLTGGRVHVQHVSAKESVDLIRQAKEQNIALTGEVTPHHLALTDEKIKTYDTKYKMNPPLRSEEDRQALIKAVADGSISVIATDHAPHTQTAKQVEFDYAPFGIIGLETALPICHKILCKSGIMPLADLIARFTKGPADVLGYKNYSLEEGNVADLTIFDDNEPYIIDSAKFYSNSCNTPFNGEEVYCKVKATMVGGKFVFNELGI